MRLGIMQPYFFPYIGYFDLINRVDHFVIFDTVRYAPKTWMNRNRILHPKESWQYISVPVDRHVGSGRLCDVLVCDVQSTKTRIRNQLDHYRRGGAPFFGEVVSILEKTFYLKEPCKLADLNTTSLVAVCDYLGLLFRHESFNQMNLVLPEINHPGQWALEIASIVGASEYVNLPSGKEIFYPDEWQQRGIQLEFTKLIDFPYATGRYNCPERLSILDVLMWNSPERIKTFLDQQKNRD